MGQFKNILLYLEDWRGASEILRRTVDLTELNGARLTIVDVVEDLSGLGSIFSPANKSLILGERVKEKRRDQLQKLAEDIRRRGVDADAMVLTGKPPLEVIRAVITRRHDLVVKAARGQGLLQELLFGTTAMHLMRECPSAVWMMRPMSGRRLRRVMAAVDPDPRDAEKTALNHKIINMAVSLAQSEGSELHIAHAWTLQMESALRGHSAGGIEREVDQMVSTLRMTHRTWVRDLADSHIPPSVKRHVHLAKGDAGRRIPEIARRERISLIVMGTVCRTGVAGFLIGNTAERVLRQVNCSVLTIKPDAFECPLKLEAL
jgi:universal stress protein E